MSRKIKITTPKTQVIAELNNSKTAESIWNVLPIQSSVSRWGDEIYLLISLRLELENGVESVNLGDLGYWPAGPAFCIFFGFTPISHGKEIRPASAVTVFGKVIGDTTILRKVTGGSQIIIDKFLDSSN